MDMKNSKMMRLQKNNPEPTTTTAVPTTKSTELSRKATADTESSDDDYSTNRGSTNGVGNVTLEDTNTNSTQQQHNSSNRSLVSASSSSGDDDRRSQMIMQRRNSSTSNMLVGNNGDDLLEDTVKTTAETESNNNDTRKDTRGGLRSSLLSANRMSSQRSLRWSRRLSVEISDSEDDAEFDKWEKNEGGEMLKTVESNEKEEDEKEEGGDENVVEYTTKRSSVVQFDTAKLPSDTLEECSATESKKTIKTVTTQNSQVFFMIGCQRSGSNWLRTMLSEREDLIAPHPPHIMRDFMPKLDRYGDLSVQKNLKILIDHVCAFVERNQVQWLDLHSRPMKFKRSAILMEVMVTLSCFTFKERYTAMQEGREFDEKIENPYYLLSIFDAIMNTLSKANGKKIWMCKSMGMSQFHDYLLSFYGKERLRYIYLVRDPRDVCNSFMKTPVGDCHPYAIAKKWAKLQNFAARILHETPDLIHQVCYEEVLGNKELQVAKIVEFMGARDVCRSMRRGSIVAIKSEKEVVRGAKLGREAKSARRLSYQFKNLGRGDSFIAGQLNKWLREMKDEDIQIVESAAYDEMYRLGYLPRVEEEDRIDFTDKLCEEYAAENERLKKKMIEDLAVENPDDLKRRQIQAAVLEKTTSEHYDEEFVKSFEIDIDDALDMMDHDVNNDKGFLVQQNGATARFDFRAWPLNASLVGFMPGVEVSKRFEVQATETVKLAGGLAITYASATQGGYYPNDRDKANQDAYIAGARVSGKKSKSKLFKKERDNGVLFAVFDGHGPEGHLCAKRAQEHVTAQFVDGMKDDVIGSLDSSDHISSTLTSAYRRASKILESGEEGIDASHSGTTAVSLFITKDSLHTANVGDSRCLLIEHDKEGKTSVNALTVDHSPDRDDEIKRIEAHGGVVMTSDQYDINDPSFTSFEQKRIWSKSGKWPGTAFTRSIGDAVAKGLGVVADPECSSFPLPEVATFVLGSDGIFDFIPDEEIGTIVKNYDNPEDACRELVGKAWNRWCSSEERADDITVIVGKIKNSKGGVLEKFRSMTR